MGIGDWGLGTLKKTFIKNFRELCVEEEINSFNFKKKISWKNKELYLYNIYCVFLESMDQRINYRKKIKCEGIENNKNYKNYTELLKTVEDKEEKDKIRTKMEYLNLFEGDFFKIYLPSFKQFLIDVKTNFEIKFGDNDLDNEKDQLLFEDYMQLLTNYEFNGNEGRLVALWNYSFVPMEMEEKINVIKGQNLLNSSLKKGILFELTENNSINKLRNGKIVLKLDNIDKYDLFTLLHDLTENNIDEYNEYYLNKSLLPREYDTDLFVIEKKSFWRQLLISIIGSQTILECVKFVFNDEENISILKDQKYLSEEVIGNIRFFIYEANISAYLIDNSFRIYEYGLFMKDEKKSIALLFFYSFNIVTNIHEICGGHLFIRTKKMNKKDSKGILDSPTIEDKNKDLYSEYAKERKAESGKFIEILLFERKIRELTIKEALFIIDPYNYIYGINSFSEKFKLCNGMNNKDIVSPKTIFFLEQLGITFNDLPNNSLQKFKISHYANLDNSKIIFNQEVLHSPGFYFGRLGKEGFDEMLRYFDFIREDIEKSMKEN